MAKGIRERLLEQAIKFHQWQEATYPGKTSEELGGEWEVDYPYWNDTYSAFCHVLTQMDAETADSVLLDEMVYLIARDNEAEGFIQETTSHPKWFEYLCRRAAASNESEAKWQFAAYLPECPCSQEVKDMILDFAKDPNEYVSRRALLAMPALRPDCVEQLTVWNSSLRCSGSGTVIPSNYRNTSGSLFWSRWMPSIPACFHNTWSRPSRMAGAICWNTQKGSKEDYCERKFIPHPIRSTGNHRETGADGTPGCSL